MNNNDLQQNEAQQHDFHKSDVMIRFLAELKTAVEKGKGVDYAFNGEDEYAVDCFDSDKAVDEVVELLKRWGMLPNDA